MSKKSVQPQDKYVLRLPDGMRDRIKAVAEKNNRSMNAEIVKTLEYHYPEPVKLEDTVRDIQETIRLLKRFRGNSLLLVLADGLDDLMSDIARSGEGTEEDRATVEKHVEEHAKRRFITPSDD